VFIKHLEGLELDSDLLTIRDDIVGELKPIFYIYLHLNKNYI